MLILPLTCSVSPLCVPESHIEEQNWQKQSKETMEQNWAGRSLGRCVIQHNDKVISKHALTPSFMFHMELLFAVGDKMQLGEARVITFRDCIRQHWADACKLTNERCVVHRPCLFSRLHPKADSSGRFNTTSFIWHRPTWEQIQGLT